MRRELGRPRLRSTVKALCAGVVTALLAATVATPSSARTSAGAETAEQPNVVVIMTDDQTLEQLRVMPATTAFFDANGVTFDNFVTSFAMCCPSRATFLTGQYALNHGVLGNGAPRGGYYALDHTNTLPVWLQAAGYRTILAGKYLNGYHALEIPPGWTDWQGWLSNEYYNYSVNDNGTKVFYGSDPDDYQTDVLADRAIESIEESAAAGDPFFLYVSAHAPHNETGAVPPAAPRDEGTFATEPLPMGPAFNEADLSDKPAYIQELSSLSPSSVEEITSYYRGELESLLAVDDMVDRVVTRLTELDLLDSTVLMFTSDNGKMHGEHRMPDGKAVPYQESIQVPLLVAGPGFPAGVHVAEQTANVDLASTIVALGGAVAARDVDGVDLRDVVATPQAYADRAVLIERYDADCFEGVRTPQYMYARYATGEEELYNLVTDPAQLQNLADRQGVAAVKADLSARVDAFIAGGFEPCEVAGPVVNVGDATVTEPRQGTVSVSVPVTLNVRNRAVTIAYTLQPRTATSGDFVAKSGTVKLKKGALISSIPVTVNGDSLAENDEAFDVVIDSVAPAIGVERGVGTVTIRNAPSGATPVINVGDVMFTEGDETLGATDLVYLTVTLSKRLSAPLTVDYATADGTALAGFDYVPSSGTVTIPAKSQAVKIPLTVLNDIFDEDEQTFTVNISSASPLATVGQSVGSITIVDDESE